MPQLGEIKSAKELNRIGTYKYMWSACISCGSPRWVPLVRGEPHKKLCPKCEYTRRKGEPVKVGQRITKGGYILVLLKPNDPFYQMAQSEGYIREHRLVMARKIGRLLKGSEIVHHLNGMRNDNREENLTLTSQGKHEKQTFIKNLQARIRQLEQLHFNLSNNFCSQ